MKVFIGRYPQKSGKDRKIRVEISDHDCWSLDTTLAHIIAPALRKFVDDEFRGAPLVDNADVPDELHSAEDFDALTGTDDNWQKRWEWVLNEMIFAFEATTSDWEKQFWIEDPELDFEKYPEDEGKKAVPIRWKNPGKHDTDGCRAFEARMANGFRLFGKYYRALWS